MRAVNGCKRDSKKQNNYDYEEYFVRLNHALDKYYIRLLKYISLHSDSIAHGAHRNGERELWQRSVHMFCHVFFLLLFFFNL